jgi:hypothetical protein
MVSGQAIKPGDELKGFEEKNIVQVNRRFFTLCRDNFLKDNGLVRIANPG